MSTATYLTGLFGLEGKRALVTGAAGGIGRATSRGLAAAGAEVLLVDIPQAAERLNELASELSSEFGRTVSTALADVTDEAQVEAAIAHAVSELGGLDIVHSNAGIISGSKRDEDIDYGAWKHNLDVNLNGMFLVGRASARAMIAQGTGGAIINTASMSGMIINTAFGESSGSAYPSAKAGVIQLTKAQASLWVKHGIRVNAVSPGYIASGIHQGMPQETLDAFTASVPMRRFGTVDEVVGAVLYLASPAASYVTGSNLVVDGGYVIW